MLVQVWALTAKTLMALNMAIFAGQLYIQSVIMCLATLSLCYLYIRWVSAGGLTHTQACAPQQPVQPSGTECAWPHLPCATCASAG